MRAAPATLALALLTPLLAGCATPDEGAPDVVATFYPLAFAAQRLAGPDVTVATLVPTGVEPHDWEPTPGDLQRAAGAKLLVAQGAGFEPWLDTVRDALGDRTPPIVYATAGLQLVPGEHEEEGAHEGEGEGEEAHAEEGEEPLDPHAWLDPVLFAQEVANVEAALVAAFPTDAEGIHARAAQLKAELDALHREYEEGLAECGTRVVIANHDAYGYLERRYGFEVVSVSGLSPEAEPSPEDLARAIEAAREHNVTIVFFEELVSPRVAQVIAEEVGAQTRVLSPIEGLTPAQREAGEDYLTLSRANLANLKEAMRC